MAFEVNRRELMGGAIQVTSTEGLGTLPERLRAGVMDRGAVADLDAVDSGGHGVSRWVGKAGSADGRGRAGSHAGAALKGPHPEALWVV